MIGANFKDFFFDKPAVQNAVDRAAARALSRFGAFVRRRDKSSIRYRKKPSDPGSPPSAHRRQTFTRKRTSKGIVSQQASSPLRELIQFGYDARNKSVVIGPAVFPRAKIGGGKAPRVVEEGGTGQFADGGKVLKVGRFAARPHTGPAFQHELPGAAALFRGTVSR